MFTNKRELTPVELQCLTGGKKPTAGDGIIDFFSWVACGFHHRYFYTGKSKTEIDLVFLVTFYQQKCMDCGHYSWTRTAPVQGPKIGTPIPVPQQ